MRLELHQGLESSWKPLPMCRGATAKQDSLPLSLPSFSCGTCPNTTCSALLLHFDGNFVLELLEHDMCSMLGDEVFKRGFLSFESSYSGLVLGNQHQYSTCMA